MISHFFKIKNVQIIFYIFRRSKISMEVSHKTSLSPLFSPLIYYLEEGKGGKEGGKGRKRKGKVTKKGGNKRKKEIERKEKKKEGKQEGD